MTGRSETRARGGPAVRRLDATDRLCLVYHAVLFFLLATAGPAGRIAGWRPWAVGHLVTLAGIGWLVWLATPGPAPRWASFLRLWYPVISLLWMYGEVGALRHLVVPADLDPLFARLDATLFPVLPHLAIPRALPVWALEALHAVYASYYLLLFVPGLFAMHRAVGEVRRYVAVLNAAMLAHYVAGILLPVSGPLALRAEVLPAGSFFLPMMNGLYAAFDRGGMAFPSTHVAASVIAATFAGRWFPRGRPFFVALAAAITFSTVACCYHYTIDALAGLATGAVALALARRGGPGRPAKRSRRR